MTIRQTLTLRHFFIFGALLFASLSVTAWIGGQNLTTTAEPPAKPRLLPVAAAVVQRANSYRRKLSYTGTVEADQQAALGFEQPGRLQAVWVDEGDRVRAGQKLAQLDTARLELELQALLATGRRETAVLQQLIAGPLAETIDAQRAVVTELEAGAKQAEQDASRQNKLLKEGVTSEETAEALHTLAQVASARLESARQRLKELLRGSRSEQVQAQAATIEQLDAEAAKLRLEMERGILLAPFPGVITNRFKDPGVVLQAGAPIFNLQSTTILKVKIGVPEKVASKLKVGSTQELFIANEKIPATLAALLPQINRQTQTRVMILNLHNETVLPGATVEWRHSQEHKADGYWLPTTALLPGRRGLWSYFLLEPENETSFRVRRQEVQIFHSEADRALVQVDSIVDGTLFISSGVNRVVPGQLVAAKFDGVVKL